MRKILALVLSLPAIAATAQQTPKRLIRPEDVYRMTTVSNPKISPDGKWVLYQQSKVDSAKDGYDGKLYMVSTDGSETGLAPRNPRRSLPVSNGNVGMTYATEVLVGPVTGNAAPKVYFVGGSFFGPNTGRASIVTTSDDGVNWSLVHVAGVTGSGLPAGSEIVSGCVAPDDANEILVAVHDTANTNSGISRSMSFSSAPGAIRWTFWGTESMKAPDPVQSSSHNVPPRSTYFFRFCTSSSVKVNGKWLVK